MFHIVIAALSIFFPEKMWLSWRLQSTDGNNFKKKKQINISQSALVDIDETQQLQNSLK